jgi:hypothetical protein
MVVVILPRFKACSKACFAESYAVVSYSRSIDDDLIFRPPVSCVGYVQACGGLGISSDPSTSTRVVLVNETPVLRQVS